MSFNFGSQNTQQQKPTLGVQPLSFGAGTQVAAVAPQSAPAFGSTATPASTFGFGTTAPTASVAPLSFGTPAAPAAAPTGLSFGQPQAATAAPGLSLGQPQASSGFSLGQPQTSTTTAGLSFGQPQAGGLSLGQPQAGAASGFSFGQQPTSSAPSLLGGGLGLSKPVATAGLFGSAAQPQANTGIALGAAPATSGLSFGAPAPTAATTAAAPTFLAPAPSGLGGTNVGLGTSASVTAPSDAKSAAAQNQKEMAIPNELLESVEEFKKFVKEERSTSSDIAHASPKIHNKISDEISAMNQLVSTLMTGLARNHALLDKIKVEAAQEIINAEIAQRTKDTPRGLQYENMAPYEYFTRLVGKFETQMVHYRRQIEETEQHLISMASGQTMSPEDVTRAFQKLHSAFIGLAGGYQNIHEQVFGLAEAFNQWHRQSFGTSVDVYPARSKGPKNLSSQSLSTGPSPFTGQDLFAQAKAALIAQVPAQVPQANPMTTPLSAGNLQNQTQFNINATNPVGVAPTQQLTGGTGLFSSTLNQTSNQQGLFGTTMSPFGAQQPASTSTLIGGKRGKH